MIEGFLHETGKRLSANVWRFEAFCQYKYHKSSQISHSGLLRTQFEAYVAAALRQAFDNSSGFFFSNNAPCKADIWKSKVGSYPRCQPARFCKRALNESNNADACKLTQSNRCYRRPYILSDGAAPIELKRSRRQSRRGSIRGSGRISSNSNLTGHLNERYWASVVQPVAYLLVRPVKNSTQEGSQLTSCKGFPAKQLC